MGTKLHPGAFDCYAAALPDEPMFILLGRDASAPENIRGWAASLRTKIIGERSGNSDLDGDEEARFREDLRKCSDAEMIAHDMEVWRSDHFGEWRGSRTRREREPIAPGLRDQIRQITHERVCSSLMSGTQQIVLIEHDVRDWTVPGFNCREHHFRFESASEAFAPLVEGRSLEITDWRVFGFEATIGDIRYEARDANSLTLVMQIMGD